MKILVTRSSMPSYEEYCEAIKPLWDSHWITNMGNYHMKLENQLKEFLGVNQISLMVNGHMALELALQAMGFPEGSEVITTPFTFISTTHSIVRNGLKPIFCDIKEYDGTIDETKIEDLITERTVAIMPVHVYGNVCNIEAIQEIANKYGLKVIYDAAHAFGIKYKGQGIGSYGDASVFSFHATKVFNTIEGGAVTFQERKFYDKLYNLKNFGIRGEEIVAEVGANAKMNEFAAIMGLCNLNNIDTAFLRRKEAYEYYEKAINEIKGIHILNSNKADNRNYAYLPIVVEDEYFESRDELYNRFAKDDIHVRKYFYPLTSDQACFKNKYRDVELSVARSISKKILTLPLFEEITQIQMDAVLNVLKGQ